MTLRSVLCVQWTWWSSARIARSAAARCCAASRPTRSASAELGAAGNDPQVDLQGMQAPFARLEWFVEQRSRRTGPNKVPIVLGYLPRRR